MSGKKKNPHAQALGRMSRGCKKRISEAHRAVKLRALERARAALAIKRAGYESA